LPFEADSSFRTFDLVFANVSPDGGFYLAFLEKAFAKLVGNYGATERVEGTISEALRALNGAPTFSFGTDSFRDPLERHKIIQMLAEAQNNKFPMGASLVQESFSKLFIYRGE
jgi:hypothetical protein